MPPRPMNFVTGFAKSNESACNEHVAWNIMSANQSILWSSFARPSLTPQPPESLQIPFSLHWGKFNRSIFCIE